MNARYEVGERLDVAIRGARVSAVVATAGADVLRLQLPGSEMDLQLMPGIHVTRVAPKEWPPRAGDVWASADGRLWFARASEDYRDDQVRMVSADPDSPSESAGTVLNHFGHMRLVYREGWSPSPAPAAAEPAGQVDERAAKIQGLREMADWLDANPDVPTEWFGTLQLHIRRRNGEAAAFAELERVAAAMGVEPDLRDEPGAYHPHAKRRFSGGVTYEAVYITEAYERGYRPADMDIAQAGEVAGPDSPQAGPANPGETAASAPDIALADGASHAAAPFCGGDASAADPVPVVTGDGAAVAHDDALPRLVHPAPITDPALLALASVPGAAVWTARIRRGLTYHKAGDLHTGCGRSQVSGELISLAEAVELGGTSCTSCYPAEG